MVIQVWKLFSKSKEVRKGGPAHLASPLPYYSIAAAPLPKRFQKTDWVEPPKELRLSRVLAQGQARCQPRARSRFGRGEA